MDETTFGDLTWMRNSTKIDLSEMRVDDVEWMQLAYEGVGGGQFRLLFAR